MNDLCSVCNNKIEHVRINEILCTSCELQWWYESKEIYDKKIKEVSERLHLPKADKL